MITVVYFWRIRKAFLPIAIINMAVNKLLLRVKFKKSFIKLLGTGKGESFTPKDADQFRWGLLITIDQSQLSELENSPVINVWRKISKNRIVWRKNLQFWRAVPPVTESLHSSPGLLNAIGIGEAPIGLQGTFSIWENAATLREFAYKGDAHVKAIAATQTNKWYSEELFARFAVIQEQGVLR